METDVIVIGAGLAGFCAALEAAATGANVTVLESQDRVGGSTVLSGGSFAFAGTDRQQALGIDDSNERLVRDFLAVGEHRNDPALVQLYADHQLDAYRFLTGRGVQFGPIQAASGQSVPRQHPANPREVIEILHAEAQRSPRITIRLNARAARLLRDGSGRVTAVRLVHGSVGATSLVARRGVVLTSGGFSRNDELLDNFAPHQAAAKRIGGPGSQGDGLKMAWLLGAGMRDMGSVKGTFGNHRDAGPEQHTAMLAVYRGAIAVNRLGRRFANESISYKLLGDACLAQPGVVGFQIFDQGVMDAAVPGVPIFDFPRRLREGLLLQADSLAELATRIDVDAQALADTVAAYNRDVAAGRDTQFGRDSLVQGFGALRRIETPPFYAYASTSAVIATYCGLTVDTQMRVLDVAGAPIPGLYAAGEITGGFHGRAFMTGTSLGKCVVCGRIAGRRAAQD